MSYLNDPAAKIFEVDSGEANWVYRVDNVLFRIPKNEHSKLELKQEVTVTNIAYKHLKNILNVVVPEFEYMHPDGSFTVSKFVPGMTCSENKIRALPAYTKQKAATKSAEIMKALSSIYPAQINTSMIDAGLDVSDFSIDQTIRTRHERFKHAASKYYPDIDDRSGQYITDYPKGITDEKSFVVHGDLHYSNILFNVNHKVVGIIDFADMIVANSTHELRNMSGFDMDFVNIVASKLDDRLGNFDRKKFLNMCILYVMLVSLRYFLNEKIVDMRHRETIDYLRNEGINQVFGPSL